MSTKLLAANEYGKSHLADMWIVFIAKRTNYVFLFITLPESVAGMNINILTFRRFQ